MSLIPPTIEYAPDECFLCFKCKYGLEKVTKESLYITLYNILKNLYGEDKLKNKNICDKCILEVRQYNELRKINIKLEEIYMSID